MRTLTLLFLIFCSLLSVSLANFRFNEQGKFTILQLTDMHYCNPLRNETKADTDATDEQTQILNKMLIETAKPDLIVLSGDAISSQIGAKKSGKQFKRCWEKVVKVIKEAGISYTYILGNHDGEGFWNATQVIKFVQEQPLNIRKGLEGIPDTCNFVLPILSSQNKEKVAANIWFFDSGSQSCGGFEYHTWGCVEKDAVDWYDQHSQKIRKEQGTKTHHFAFVHIPLPEFADLANNGEFYGVREERVSCPNINTGLFDRIKKNGDISGIFVGHDHVNNMAGWHKGVELVYGQKSGYGAYGFIRGARVITLEEYKNKKGELKVRRSHNILFENGTIAEPTSPRKDDRNIMTVCPIYGHSPTQKIIGSFRKSFWEIKTWIKQLFA